MPYYSGIGTTLDIAKAEKILAEYIALLGENGHTQCVRTVN
ncbi:hypothetical protein Q7542_11870 [Glaesserella parasuis]|nr:hypothetical protein [Glaesserella parasuis]